MSVLTTTTLAISWLLCSSAPPAPGSSAPPQVRITNLYDAFGDARGQLDWGYAALVEHDGRRILFDTGHDLAKLSSNLKALDVSLGRLDAIVISHVHDDHTAGLVRMAASHPRARIYLPSAALREGLTEPDRVVVVDQDLEPWPGVRLQFGERPKARGHLREVTLALSTPSGEVLVVGCGHPGLVNIVRSARAHGPVRLVTGGFHLLKLHRPKLERISDLLQKELGVGELRPAHCTGKLARQVFAERWGTKGKQAGLGSVIELPR